MTEIQLGKVMLTFKGEYDSTKTYIRLDAVTYQGSSYVCLSDTTSAPPSESWQLLADKGATGDVGPQGPQGNTGPAGPQGDKGDQGDPGLNHYTVDLTDAKYDRNKWYYVDTNGYPLGSLGGPSYFSLEAPLGSVRVPYGNQNATNGSGNTCARQTVLYGLGYWGTYNRKLIVLDDQNPTEWTTDGKRLLTFAVPSDYNLSYAFYARGGLKINIASDVPGLVWTPHTDNYVVNDTTIPILNDAPDPKTLGLDDDHTFWALSMSQLKQQFKPGGIWAMKVTAGGNVSGRNITDLYNASASNLPEVNDLVVQPDGNVFSVTNVIKDTTPGAADGGATFDLGPALFSIKGYKGDKGDTGATGPAGPAGKDGQTPDVSNLATKTDLATKADKSELVDYAKLTDIPNLTGYLKQTDLADYAKSADVPKITKTAWSDAGITYINGAEGNTDNDKLNCRAVSIGDVHIVQVKGWFTAGSLGNHNFLPQVQVPAFGFENDDYYFEAKGSVTSYDSFIQVDSKAKCQINLYSYSTQNGPSIPLNAMWIY